MTQQTTAATFQRVAAILEGRPKGDHGATHLIAQIIDNVTAQLEDATGKLAETEKQLAMVRATRDAYLRELGTLRDRLARADVGPRPTDARIADALENIAAALGVKYPAGSVEEIIDEIANRTYP